MSPQAAKTELRPGSLLSGKYKLQRQLGRGASGAVWSAINVATSRKVALKVLLRPEPKARERLLREARAAGALKHPNVVDVYDVIVADDGSPALVLEFLEGQTLEQLIAERAPLPEIEVAAIARDVARALGVAHASGIVHRDLKPANIFLHRASEDDAPVVKVVDFGISKNTLSREETLTETGMAVGSPSFMSPEQVRGERDLDGRTDLWALGVIMYEMLSAKRLFDGRAHEVLTHVLTQPIKPLRELVAALDPEIDRIVTGLLERDLGRRLASAEEVAAQLTAFTSSAKGRSQHPTDSPPTSRSQQRNVGSSIPSSVPRDVSSAGPSSVPRDTSVTQVPKPAALPVIHADDEDEEEATHVAPMAMRQALAQRTVPAVYEDDDEDEEDRTRVAPDAILTAAIQASKQAPPESERPVSEQNNIPTVRPPGLARGDTDPPAGATIADKPPVTGAGTQVMSAQQAGPPSSGGASAARKAPPDKAPPAAAKLPASPAARPAVDPAARPPVSPAAKGAPPAARAPLFGAGTKSPAMGPAIGRLPLSGASAAKPHAPTSPNTPVHGAAPRVAIPVPPAALAPAHAHEETPVAHGPLDSTPQAQPISERASPQPISERAAGTAAGATAPVSERAADAIPSSRRAAPKLPPSGRPEAEDLVSPRVVIDKSVSERAPALAPPVPSDPHSPSPDGHPPSAPHEPHAADNPHEKPSAVETAVHRIPTERSDAVRTWVLTLVVAALVILAAYLYTHRG